MKLSIMQDALAAALKTVSRAVSARAVLSVLNNVYIEAVGGEHPFLRVIATNLELSIQARVMSGVAVAQQGAITLPYRTLNDLVNTLSAERIDLTLDAERSTVLLECGSTKAHVRGMAADKYPAWPGSEGVLLLAVSGPLYRQALRGVVGAAATEDYRQVLTGVLHQVRDGLLTLAAADGYRLAVDSLPLAEAVPDSDLLIPRSALEAVLPMLSDGPLDVYTSRGGTAVLYDCGDVDVVTTLLDGKFPDYNAIIPKSRIASLTINPPALAGMLKRAEIFARDVNGNVRLAVDPPAPFSGGFGYITVDAKSAERGSTDERLTVEAGEGQATEAAFNVRYLLDALAWSGVNEAYLDMTGPTSPAVIRRSTGWQCVVMPMSVGR